MLSEQRLYENIRESLLGKTQIRRNGNFTKNSNFSKKKPQFNVDEIKLLIDFFNSHPSVWNHNTTDYRDRNLRDFLLEK